VRRAAAAAGAAREAAAGVAREAAAGAARDAAAVALGWVAEGCNHGRIKFITAELQNPVKPAIPKMTASGKSPCRRGQRWVWQRRAWRRWGQR
jgi:hypothetical protein